MDNLADESSRNGILKASNKLLGRVDLSRVADTLGRRTAMCNMGRVGGAFSTWLMYLC